MLLYSHEFSAMNNNFLFHPSKMTFSNLGPNLIRSQEKRVLVLHTGGTIGMVPNSDNGFDFMNTVLDLQKGAFKSQIRRLQQFHDENYWKLRKKDADFDSSFLVFPETDELEERIIYKIMEYETLLVSPNVTEIEWIRIAKDIKKYYEEYQGFVILHGTDTLPYTASALSFMLENLGKCVVLTGSQIPLYRPRSDGRNNFVSSLIIAAGHDIPEVTVFFGNNLYRGNRCRKLSASKLLGFDSPNCETLVNVEVEIQVNRNAIFRPNANKTFEVHEKMSRNVGILKLFPNINAAVVKAFLKPPIEGVVLETCTGQMPTNRTDLTDIICEASKRGVILVNIDQCVTGAVDPDEEDLISAKCGVISGHDMTPEAALTKLSYVLTKDELALDQKKKMMYTNIRGEMSRNYNIETVNTILEAINTTLKIQSKKKLDKVNSRVSNALLWYGITQNDLVAVKKMIDEGADVNALNSEGKSLLHEAVQKKNRSIVEFLLKNGANIHLTSVCGETSLLTAIHNDDIPMIDLLMKHGADIANINVKCLSEMWSQAARCGSVRRLETLNKVGTDLNIEDEMKQTPLHKAVLCGHTRAVEYLVSNGANLHVKDVLGYEPMDYAKLLKEINSITNEIRSTVAERLKAEII